MIKTKQELLNHFSDINTMYNNPFMYQTLSNMIDELLEQQPSEDCISRAALLAKIDAERKHLLDLKMDGAEHIIVHHARRIIEDMPSVTPKENDKLKYLTDRPCEVCEFHSDNGCRRWKCVFEEGTK